MDRNFLIIGYGNQLRGDDAAGVVAAQQIEEQNWHKTQVIVQQQLTPELAELVSQAGSVVFLDASASIDSTITSVQILEPQLSESFPAHSADPRSIVTLAQVLYHRAPKAWFITIPSVCFDFGAPLSEMTRLGIDVAINETRRLWQIFCTQFGG